MSEQGNNRTEIEQQSMPLFDIGNVTIEHLSISPEGFEVKTDKTNRRREFGSPFPFNQEQREQLKKAMAGELKFAEGDKAKIALDKLRSATDEEKPQAWQEYEERRQVYKRRSKPLIGVRNIRAKGNTLVINVKTTDYTTFQEFGNPDVSPAIKELAVVSSTSVVIVTRDNRLILQQRSKRNSMWGDVPGASAAGYLEGSLSSNPISRGVILPIDTDYLKRNAIKEANEELGLEKDDFSKIKIIGIGHEKLKTHDDFIFLSYVNLTAKELTEKALKASKNAKLSEQEFYEKFVDITASPQTITTLLTQVKCPIPLSHVAVFAAVGYSMVVEEVGAEKANEWLNKLQANVKKNYEDIDDIVKDYYLKSPSELTNIPERYRGKNVPQRNQKGYSPYYLPQEQGLPDMISELKRVGLLN